jgi:hypothetical protein
MEIRTIKPPTNGSSESGWFLSMFLARLDRPKVDTRLETRQQSSPPFLQTKKREIERAKKKKILTTILDVGRFILNINGAGRDALLKQGILILDENTNYEDDPLLEI